MARKKELERGKVKDLRTKSLWKGDIGDRQPAIFVPDGETNELMDLVFDGEVIGDAEIGQDGFLEIMFLIRGIGFVKIKRLPDQKAVGMFIV